MAEDEESTTATETESEERVVDEAPCALQTASCIEMANGQCETCQFIARDRQKMLLRSVTVVFLILELVMASICLALEFGFELCGNYLRYYVYHPREKNVHLMITYTRLTYTTTGAIAMIFVPLLLLCVLFTRKFCIFSFMSFLLGIAGFGTFLTVCMVAFVQAHLPGADAAPFQGFAGCALVTSLIFLCHVIYEIWKYSCKGFRYAK